MGSHNLALFALHLLVTDILLEYLHGNHISHLFGNEVEQLLTFVIPGEGISLPQGILTFAYMFLTTYYSSEIEKATPMAR